jgi:predicted negative regulator of RcsB-dependent stress response
MSEAHLLDSLGYLAHHTGRYQDALDYYRQALTGLRSVNSTFFEADTLHRIGDTHAAQGQADQARHAWHQALRLYQAQHRTQDAQLVQRQLADLASP